MISMLNPLVAERIVRIAQALGDPRRVIAGTDCGFKTTIGLAPVAEEVVWEKLCATRDGAMLASRQLFGQLRRRPTLLLNAPIIPALSFGSIKTLRDRIKSRKLSFEISISPPSPPLSPFARAAAR
jgi:hypothetical protein